jgi:hypothetical protein
MDIVNEFPPNIDDIKKVFPITGKEIFAYGNTIYNPTGVALPPWLIAHEEVHQAQQAGDPAWWWGHYLDDPQFRFEQELEAHIEEYRVFCTAPSDRTGRRLYLRNIARRLSSPMYGNMVSYDKARRLIKQGTMGTG